MTEVYLVFCNGRVMSAYSNKEAAQRVLLEKDELAGHPDSSFYWVRMEVTDD